MENKIFIKNIKYLREYLNLTQTEFGNKLGKRYNTIQNWERGRSIPDNTTIEHIKNTFNISLDWLFYDKGNMFIDNKTDEFSKIYNSLSDENKLKALEYIKTLLPLNTAKNADGGGYGDIEK